MRATFLEVLVERGITTRTASPRMVDAQMAADGVADDGGLPRRVHETR